MSTDRLPGRTHLRYSLVGLSLGALAGGLEDVRLRLRAHLQGAT